MGRYGVSKEGRELALSRSRMTTQKEPPACTDPRGHDWRTVARDPQPNGIHIKQNCFRCNVGRSAILN